MRHDMAKLICERPRYFIPFGGSTKGRVASDPESLPRQEGLRRAKDSYNGRKQLDDYLSPLRRYLTKQVGRPWNKVHSEICEVPGSRTLKAHLRRHVDDFVAIQRRDCRPFYVDPRTGILRRNGRG